MIRPNRLIMSSPLLEGYGGRPGLIVPRLDFSMGGYPGLLVPGDPSGCPGRPWHVVLNQF